MTGAAGGTGSTARVAIGICLTSANSIHRSIHTQLVGLKALHRMSHDNARLFLLKAARIPPHAPIPQTIEADLARLKSTPKSQDDAIVDLLDLEESEVDLDDLTYPV